MKRNKVKVELFIDGDVKDHLKSLSKMFLMSFDDAINLILRLEMQKVKDGQEG